MIKWIPVALTFLPGKIEDVMFILLYHTFDLHQRQSNSNDNESLLLLFDDLWKKKGKYMQYTILYRVPFLNTWAKLQNTRRASRHPALMGNCRLVVLRWPYQSTKWFVISLFQIVCRTWDCIATREVPLEKNVDMKCIQVKRTQKYSEDDKILIMLNTLFKVNLSTNSLLKTNATSEVQVNVMVFETTTS